ncbi:phage protein [Lysinibacillus fusiformis]|uniref:phage protein n=1 Tax=Lysinibacillus fusiformis TaxID=28031 RepID=UPI003CFC85D1
MSNLFMRKTTFLVGGREITDPLTIKFSVPFGDNDKVDTIDIQIYNLKDETINSISINQVAILSAGYVEDNGVIFSGTLKKKETKWEGLDKITTFKCIDCTLDYTRGVVKRTYGRNTPASLILRELARDAGLAIGDIDLPVDFIYRSGKALNGKIKFLVSEIAKDCKAKLHINKGRMYVRDQSKGDKLGLDISKETGLIDQPEEIEEEVKTENKAEKKKEKNEKSDKKSDGKKPVSKPVKKKLKGYKIKLLLNHKITTDVIIKLTSRKVSGVFRVSKGEHKGDTSGTEYYTECEVVPV